jgi:hypothetical protein
MSGSATTCSNASWPSPMTPALEVAEPVIGDAVPDHEGGSTHLPCMRSRSSTVVAGIELHDVLQRQLRQQVGQGCADLGTRRRRWSMRRRVRAGTLDQRPELSHLHARSLTRAQPASSDPKHGSSGPIHDHSRLQRSLPRSTQQPGDR